MDLASLFSSELVKGGLVLMLSGGLIYALKGSGRHVWFWLKSKCTVYVDVYNNDDLFKDTLAFLHDKHLTEKARVLSATTKYEKDGRRLIFSPAPGIHLIWYERRPIWLWRYRKEVTIGNSASLLEYFKLVSLGRDKTRITKLLNSASKWADNQDAGKLVVYCDDGYGTFVRRSRKRKRSLDSVVLDRGIMEDVVDDLGEFLKGAEWYFANGIPYQRTYLFHGPGGTGKTSAIMSVASAFDLSISIVGLLDPEMTDDKLVRLFHSAHSKTILLIEDVNEAFSKRGAPGRNKHNKLTFTGLTTALDGVSSHDGRLVMMTTNHLDELDEVLIRPGRVDRKFFIGLASTYQVRRMFLRFFPAREDLADNFCELMGDAKTSPADIQSLLMTHKNDPEGIFSGYFQGST